MVVNGTDLVSPYARRDSYYVQAPCGLDDYTQQLSLDGAELNGDHRQREPNSAIAACRVELPRSTQP